jgi:hypothetical protein
MKTKTPEDLISKYVAAQSELLDIKLHLRTLLNYPGGDPSNKQMIYMLAEEMSLLNKKIAGD